MIAGHITVTLPEGMTETVVIAPGISGGSSVLDIMTEIEIMIGMEIVAAVGDRWMIYIEEGIAMTITTGEISAALVEIDREMEGMTGTGEGDAIAMTKLEKSLYAFPIPALRNKGTDIC